MGGLSFCQIRFDQRPDLADQSMSSETIITRYLPEEEIKTQ